MVIYHIINRTKELDATTNLRTAKAQAKKLNALAVVAVDTYYTQDGMQSKLLGAYVRTSSIVLYPTRGIYVTCSPEDLKKMATHNCHLLPPKFLDSFAFMNGQDA